MGPQESVSSTPRAPLTFLPRSKWAAAGQMSHSHIEQPLCTPSRSHYLHTPARVICILAPVCEHSERDELQAANSVLAWTLLRKEGHAAAYERAQLAKRLSEVNVWLSETRASVAVLKDARIRRGIIAAFTSGDELARSLAATAMPHTAYACVHDMV